MTGKIESSLSSTANNWLSLFLKHKNMKKRSILYDSYSNLFYRIACTTKLQEIGQQLKQSGIWHWEKTILHSGNNSKEISCLTDKKYQDIIRHYNSEPLSKRYIDEWFKVDIGRIQRWSYVSCDGLIQKRLRESKRFQVLSSFRTLLKSTGEGQCDW